MLTLPSFILSSLLVIIFLAILEVMVCYACRVSCVLLV
jgi:hypothetical protein